MAESTPPYLQNLNAQQLAGVTYPPQNGALQLLAGPGSGKTRVLTCRVAYLIKECNIPPECIVVVTFTNKAANEMKERLHVLIGEKTASKLVMGTFHSIAVKYLRKYAQKINMPNNFLITSHDDTLAILRPICAKLKDSLESESQNDFKPKVVYEHISKAKAAGDTIDTYLIRIQKEQEHVSQWHRVIKEAYQDYEDQLRKSDAMDFDDLLTYAKMLFEKAPEVVKNVRTCLIDEFQDTSTVQFEMSKLLAKASGSLTTVGDPDQSVYAWRNAKVENLALMQKAFKNTKQIFLEENYRSCQSILTASIAVVDQDTKRIKKSLYSLHPDGPKPHLKQCLDPQTEATFIANDIKRIIALSGGQIDFNDIAILFRNNYLSRSVEAALQSNGIPSRMVGGHKFFDREEIKDVLAYLQLVENPAFTSAFSRVVNVPKRAVGAKTLEEIVNAARKDKITPFEVVAKAVRGSSIGGIKPAQKKMLKVFIECIGTMKKMATSGASVSELIDFMLEIVGFRSHLERTHPQDHAARWENVQELKAYSVLVAKENGEYTSEHEAASRKHSQKELTEEDYYGHEDTMSDNAFDEMVTMSFSQSSVAVGVDVEDELPPSNPLRTFLAASMLSTDSETDEAKADKDKSKVTLSTCHSAKGLEWPVVYIPGVEQDTFPFYRSDDPDEERRLLYVSMTRAKVLLTITACNNRYKGSEKQEKELSSFIKDAKAVKPVPFSFSAAPINPNLRDILEKVAGKPRIDDETVKQMAEKYAESRPQTLSSSDLRPALQSSNTQAPYTVRNEWGGSGSTNPNQWNSINQRSTLSLPAYGSNTLPGFGSAKSLLSSNALGGGQANIMPVPQRSKTVGISVAETRTSIIGSGVVVQPTAAKKTTQKKLTDRNDEFDGLIAGARAERSTEGFAPASSVAGGSAAGGKRKTGSKAGPKNKRAKTT